MEHVTPIYILSGFLGSGKTTLLSRLITSFSEGLRPAIVMNEIGEVNIEGLVAGEEVPTAEMLSGCICCTIRSDLSSEIAMLIQRERPDVIVIEATGIANPMEILDAAAEASLYMRIDVKTDHCRGCRASAFEYRAERENLSFDAGADSSDLGTCPQ